MASAVRFLGVEQRFVDGLPDWRAVDQTKLWRYNLHYFDYLLWPAVADARKAALIESWIAQNPLGSPDAWDPYSVSLRIVNWVKFLAACGATPEVPAAWLESLGLQAAWLERNLEREILANHYFKNAKALVFAGSFFQGAEAPALNELGRSASDVMARAVMQAMVHAHSAYGFKALRDLPPKTDVSGMKASCVDP